MGSRNLDRVPLHEWADRVKTVDLMIAEKWQVLADCPACRVRIRVDLNVIRQVKGGSYSLWNRRPPCKVFLCNGRVRFFAQNRHRPMFEELATP